MSIEFTLYLPSLGMGLNFELEFSRLMVSLSLKQDEGQHASGTRSSPSLYSFTRHKKSVRIFLKNLL